MGAFTLMFSFVIIVFIVIGLPLLFLLFLVKTLSGKKKGSSNTEDAQLIQVLHQGMTRLEQRIGALETILIEHERTKED